MTNFFSKLQLFSLVFVLTISIQAQKNYKKEMISSGEKAEKKISENVKIFSTDYKAYKRTKAWNIHSKTTSIFTNTKEVDMPNIGGRVKSLLVDKANDIALAAPSGGGIWTFNPDDGSSFAPVNDFGSFLSVTYLSQSPRDPKIIMAATGDRHHSVEGYGVFSSVDGGRSFTPLTSTNPENNPDFRYIKYVKYSPENPDIIYIAAEGSSKSKIYKSINLGTSWIEVFNTSSRIRSLEFTKGNGVIVAVQDRGLYKSTTGDANSFSLITNTIPNNSTTNSDVIDGVVVATHAANRDIAYAFFTNEDDNSFKVFKTINSGVNWQEVSTTVPFYVSLTWFCLAIGVHPTNPDIVAIGSVGWGYTTDGGNTWINAAELEVDYHDVHFHSSDPNVAYIGYDQGIGRVDFNKSVTYRVWDGSRYVNQEQAEQLEIGKQPGFNTSQIYYGDYFPEAYGDAYLMGQQDGGCFATVNNIHRRIMVGDGGSVFINKQDPDKAFASTQSGRIRNTSKALMPNFNDYTDVTIPGSHPNWITQFAGNNKDGNQVYVPQRNDLYRSSDNGNTFNSIVSYNMYNPKVTVEDNINPVVYVAGSDSNSRSESVVYRIENANSSNPISKRISISTVNLGSPDKINIDPNDNNTVFITYSNGDAYELSSLNSNSVNKKTIKGDITDVKFNSVISIKDNEDILIAGTNTGVFFSTDRGENWLLSNDFPYTQITDLKYRESDSKLFVFTYGRGAWVANISTDALSIDEIETKNEDEIIVFPNPARDIINIKTNKVYKNINVIIYDLQGNQVIKTESLKNIDVKFLSSGMYVLHVLENNTIINTIKIMLK